MKKSGVIAEFGYVRDNEWKWDIATRRPLLDWERVMWNDFLRLVDSSNINPEMVDSLAWTSNSNGLFTIKSFCKSAKVEYGPLDKIWELVWSGLSPPNVEAFVWRLVHGRIPTKIELSKREAIGANEVECPLCKENAEIVPHLFCHCKYAWTVWSKWCNVWNIHFTMPSNIRDLLLSWKDMTPKFVNGQVWIMCAFSFIWSIWKCRNDAVFNARNHGVEYLFDQAVLRLAWWSKTRWPDGRWAVTDIVADPSRLKEVQTSPTTMQQTRWTAPGRGSLKFNTDAAVQGSYGMAGVGGVLRDENAKILMYFSKGVGVCDVMTAVLVAINKALTIFVDSKWSKEYEVILESDNKIAIEWLLDHSLSPAHFRNLIYNSLEASSRIRCRFSHVSREGNSLADNLAKRGGGGKSQGAGILRATVILKCPGQPAIFKRILVFCACKDGNCRIFLLYRTMQLHCALFFLQ
ncbi:hypothetical protein HRI_002018400 [Hibiscus trionum]|uniref:RNase H type-1 domain-containing protein n=1 Tax=Hibiscus trionum TaxID=183268 RepID=A0A9W7HU89_HIBTR|nr:hypothetical protein HRI_002018400 [Hibiscus trionum]